MTINRVIKGKTFTPYVPSRYLWGYREILQPKEHFDSNPQDLVGVVDMVRRGFGRDLDFDDIYNHITLPEKVFLLKDDYKSFDKKIIAMISYNKRNFSGYPCLIVEGVCIDPSLQGNGVFREILMRTVEDETAICLRTQSPRMYRALEKYCDGNDFPYRFKGLFPNILDEMYESIISILNEFAKYLNCMVDEKFVIKGFYESLFYGREPEHKGEFGASKFFKEDLGMDLSNGDAVLVTGINPKAKSIPEDLWNKHVERQNRIALTFCS